MKFRKGDKVEGVLFNEGTVIAVGSASDLRKYDASGACSELDMDTPCVAVDTDGGIAVYVEDEVWRAA